MKHAFRFWFNFAILCFQITIFGLIGWNALRIGLVVLIVLLLVSILILEWGDALK